MNLAALLASLSLALPSAPPQPAGRPVEATSVVQFAGSGQNCDRIVPRERAARSSRRWRRRPGTSSIAAPSRSATAFARAPARPSSRR